MKTIAKLYVQNDWRDEEVKRVVDELFVQSVDELYVLPVYLERMKNLLQGLTTRVGSFVDYPCSFGTPERKAFEVVELFRKGADKLLVPVFFHLYNEESYTRFKNLHAILKPATFGRRDLVYLLNTRMFTGNEWIEVAHRLRALGICEVAFEIDDISKGVLDVSLFHQATEGKISFSAYVSSAEEFSPALFFEVGAKGVGRIVGI